MTRLNRLRDIPYLYEKSSRMGWTTSPEKNLAGKMEE